MEKENKFQKFMNEYHPYFYHSMKHYFDFNGRASTEETADFLSINVILGTIALSPFISWGIAWPAQIWLIGMGIPFITLWVRRLHDLGYSGKWVALPFVMWGLAFAFGRDLTLKDDLMLILVITIAPLVPLFFLILWLFWPIPEGREGPNQYGEKAFWAPTPFEVDDEEQQSSSEERKNKNE